MQFAQVAHQAGGLTPFQARKKKTTSSSSACVSLFDRCRHIHATAGCPIRTAAASRVLPVLCILSVCGMATAQTIIGRNFTGDTYLLDSFSIPPDTMGAVGVDHYVETINGRYSVFRKSDGARVQTSTLDQFWINAGVTPTVRSFDPRVAYDPYARRWYAAALDNPSQANSFLLAVSSGSDPTGGWTGFKIDSDTDDSNWADFTMLGYNAEGVFLSANMPTLGAAPFATGFVVVPKVNLLAPVPSLAGMTQIQDMPLALYGGTPQLAVDMNNEVGTTMPVLSMYNTAAGRLQRSEITPPGSPSLVSVGSLTVAGASQPPVVDQPGPKQDLEANDSRFSSNTVLFKNDLWGVHSIDVGGRAGARWFRIDTVNNAVIASGTISDPSLAFTFPSIAVNEFGNVVIGMTGTSTTQFASSYAAIGTTIGTTTAFGSPILLRAGTNDYQVLDSQNHNRWGDYSSTTADPADPGIFWTDQEYVSANNVWSTNVSELIILQPNEARWADPVPSGMFDDPTMWHTTHGGAPLTTDRVVFSRATDPASATVVFPPAPVGVYVHQSASIRQGHWRLELSGNQWDLAKQLEVGPYGGEPRVTIANGTVNSSAGFVASRSYSRAVLGLENARWTVTDLAVGGVPGAAGGDGVVNLSNSTLDVGGTLRVWPRGRVNVFSGSIDCGSLEVVGGNITLAHITGPANVLRCTDIAVHSGGVIDVGNNFILVDYSGPSAIPPVSIAILSGYAAGAWTGPGINSSTAASFTDRGVGFAEATDLFTVFPALYRGQTIDSTTVIAKYTWYADSNLDGQVDISDLGILASHWQTTGMWSHGDSDFSGFIDISDLGLLATNWQKGVGSPLGPSLDEAMASLGLAGATVPDPTSGFLLCGLGIVALGRRHSVLPTSEPPLARWVSVAFTPSLPEAFSNGPVVLVSDGVEMWDREGAEFQHFLRRIDRGDAYAGLFPD